MISATNSDFGFDTADPFKEPDPSVDTLAHLGPLAPLAGVWQSAGGYDNHPVKTGAETAVFIEHYEAQPLDPQTNGPQLFYGLRYHTRITQPGSVAMFHEQVGFWLWEPDSRTILLTVATPRGQVALADGTCEPDATSFEVRARRDTTTFGIASNPFLDTFFRTESFRMTVTIASPDEWSYDENTRLILPDRDEPFDHVDRNTLHRVAPPTPNPLALAARSGQPSTPMVGDGSLGIGKPR
jgi:hypothetical protein